MGQGLSTQKIAEKLSLSAKTVEVHRTHIKKKLNIEDSAQLMREAVRWVERGAI
jgi:DNA-binding CsgD family transcriptional regulator